MSYTEKENCRAEIEQHEQEIQRLSASLHGLDDAGARTGPHAIYLAAQVIRHRISVALIESHLDETAPSHS